MELIIIIIATVLILINNSKNQEKFDEIKRRLNDLEGRGGLPNNSSFTPQNLNQNNSFLEEGVLTDEAPLPPTVNSSGSPVLNQSVPVSGYNNDQVPKLNESNLYQSYYGSETKEEKKNDFIEWIKEGFLLKLGSLFVLISIGWFISYAFIEKNWIGEIGVTTIGIIFGAVILIWGTLRVLSQKKFGDVFIALGTAVVLLVTAYATAEYKLFGDGYPALLLMLITLIFATFVSVKFDLRNVTRINLTAAGFLPIMAGIDIFSRQNEVFAMVYMLTILLGALWAVWVTRWRELIMFCLVIAISYSVVITDGGWREDLSTVTIVLSFVTILIFFVTNIVGIVRQEVEEKTKFILPSLVALGTVFLIGIWSTSIFDYRSTSLNYQIAFLLFAWALVFAFGSFVITRLTRNKKAFYLYGTLSLVLLGISTAYAVESVSYTLVFSLEIFALVLAAVKITNRPKIPVSLSILYGLPVLFSLEDFKKVTYRVNDKYRFSSIGENLASSEFIAITALTSVLLVTTFIFSGLFRKFPEEKKDGVKIVYNAVGIITGLSLSWWYNLFLQTIFLKDFATFVSIFTFVALGLVLLNIKLQEKGYRIAGYIFLIYGIISLFFNTGALDILYKVLIFAVIGVLFIVTEINKKRHAEK